MKVFVNFIDPRWKKYKIDFDRIARCAVRYGIRGADSEFSITLTDDSELQALNKKYRGIDRPTNVLSFETGDDKLLGDIFLSFDTTKSEIRDLKSEREFVAHATHLVVHGILHLLGYDHIKDSDASRMEAVEIRILAKLGIKNPYENFASQDFMEKGKEKKEDTKQISQENCCCYICRNDKILHILFMFLFGAITSFGFAPWNLWWMSLFGIGMAYAIGRKGFWFGAGYGLASFWWMLNSIFVVPDLAARFAIYTIPAALGIAVVCGLMFGSPFLFSRRGPVIFAASWTMVLWLREFVLTGFPWNPVANIALPWPALANSMSLWGALGLTFIITGLTASAVEVIRRKVCGTFIIFSSLLIVGVWYGYKNISDSQFALSDSPVLRIVQPAIPQTEKFSRETAADNVKKIAELGKNIFPSADSQSLPFKRGGMQSPDLLIFPETAYPYLIMDYSLPMADEFDVPIVIGAMSYLDGKYYNSMLLAHAGKGIERVYNKSHLVPFGEYSPLGGLLPSPGRLSAGRGPELIALQSWGKDKREEAKSLVFIPAICYEIIFSDSLVPSNLPRSALPAAAFQDRGRGLPDMIINITNDAWFGKTPGTYQHLDMARRQAIESGLPVARANYSGISAFIGADGHVISSLPIGVAGVLDGQLGGAHITPYRHIGLNGWMIIILAFSILAVFASKSRKKD